MTDHGLDLAVIGDCRTAALVDPTARLVWWCYPRFDADPVFSRLLAGHEEKGFSDVVLDGMADAERIDRAWNPKPEAFTAAFGSDDLDASVLLLPELGVCEVDDPRFVKTVAAGLILTGMRLSRNWEDGYWRS